MKIDYKKLTAILTTIFTGLTVYFLFLNLQLDEKLYKINQDIYVEVYSPTLGILEHICPSEIQKDLPVSSSAGMINYGESPSTYEITMQSGSFWLSKSQEFDKKEGYISFSYSIGPKDSDENKRSHTFYILTTDIQPNSANYLINYYDRKKNLNVVAKPCNYVWSINKNRYVLQS